MPLFEKILCPTDFSDASCRALDAAVDMVRERDGEICIVHVEPNFQAALASGALPAHQAADQRAEAICGLRQVIHERMPVDVRAYTDLRQGEVASQIVAAVKEHGAKLIVMTTHGAGGHRPCALGSVATEILQNAPCPVLLLNADPKTGGCDSAKASAGIKSHDAHLNGHDNSRADFTLASTQPRSPWFRGSGEGF